MKRVRERKIDDESLYLRRTVLCSLELSLVRQEEKQQARIAKNTGCDYAQDRNTTGRAL